MSESRYTRETITELRTWVPGKLFSFRLTRPSGYRFVPGQFARLGLPPKAGVSDSVGTDVAWRAYSMVSADYDEHLEFFSIVVPGGAFTGRLHELRVGDEVWLERQAFGFLTTDRFQDGDSLWMLASGTGLAPFVSILHDLRVWDQFKSLIVVHSVRSIQELAYRDLLEGLNEHPYFGELLRAEPGRFRYIPTITRPPHPEPMLDARIQRLITDGRLEQAAERRLDPATARIMLCGNPEMVTDLRQLLKGRGFQAGRRGQPGNLVVENYW